MNNNEIELARKKYNSLLVEKNRLELVKKRLLRLEKDPKVQEYISLVEFINSARWVLESEESMAFDSFHEIAKSTKNSNNVLVYLGSYKQDDDSLTDIECADYLIYEDLEQFKSYNVEPHARLEFEKDHKVIYLENKNISCYKEYLIELYKLRSKIFKELLTRPQEEVVEEILQSNKQLVKGK